MRGVVEKAWLAGWLVGYGGREGITSKFSITKK